MHDLPPSPAWITNLEKDHRGYPIPWFVARPANGPVDFRVIDPQKFDHATRLRLCWICGQPLGSKMAFIGGPISVSQRLYADPGSHINCAKFALKVCPFLAIPTAQRRTANLPPHTNFGGLQASDNPQVFGLLITSGFKMQNDGNIHAKPRSSLEWWCNGRPATAEEVRNAIVLAKSQLPPRAEHISVLLDNLPVPAH